MAKFLRLATGIDPLPILLELQRAPHLWDRDTTRTTFEGTPFAGTSDIWVPFRAAADVKGLHSHREEYRGVYWPAWSELPALPPLLRALKQTVDAVEIGTVLITRMPPGSRVLMPCDRLRSGPPLKR